MEIKVKAIEGSGEKSTQEVEKELLEKHEEQLEDSSVQVQEKTETPVEEVPQVESKEETKEEASLTDDDVLSYIENRYGKKINSFDELMEERETSEELPEDVAAYFKYKKDTGRGIEDYVKLQRDFDSMESDNLLLNTIWLQKKV